MVIKTSEINFDKNGEEVMHRSVRELSVVPASGSTTVQLQPTGAVNTKIFFGSQPHYRDISKLRGVLNIPAQAAGVHAVIHTQPAVVARNIRLTSAQGQVIASVQNINGFLRCASQMLTDMDEFETNDKNLPGLTEADAYVQGAGKFFAANNSAVGTGTESAYNGTGKRPISTNAMAAANLSASDLNFVEQNYITYSDAGTVSFMPFEIPLSIFKETDLAYSKLDYMPQDMILSIDWAHVYDLGYGADGLAVGSTKSDLTGTFTISDIELVLAVEANVEMAAAKMDQVRSGGSTRLIPFLTGITNATSGTASSYSLPLNMSWGQNLLAIYTELHNSVDTSSLAHDISNIAADGTLGAKVLTMQTKFDNQNLQENVLDCTKLQDYKYLKPILEGCCAQNANVWNYNRCYVDSWRAGRSADWSQNNIDGIVDGVSLEGNSKSWQIVQTHAAGSNLLQRYWVVTQRRLTVAPVTGLVSIM